MVQSPSWEANWFAASQEIPRISRTRRFITAPTSDRCFTFYKYIPVAYVTMIRPYLQ